MDHPPVLPEYLPISPDKSFLAGFVFQQFIHIPLEGRVREGDGSTQKDGIVNITMQQRVQLMIELVGTGINITPQYLVAGNRDKSHDIAVGFHKLLPEEV